MNGTITYDKIGRVVLPKAIRDKCPAKTFLPILKPNGIFLESVMEKPRRVVRVDGVLMIKDAGTKFDAGQVVREERDSRA